VSAPWFRMYHRIIDDEKIRLLAFEDRWHFVALCCLKADGLLDEPESDLKWRKVSIKLGVQTRELEEICRRLNEVGLVDEYMQPLAWDELQFKNDSSVERVRKYREKRQANGLTKHSEGYLRHRPELMRHFRSKCAYCGSKENLCIDHIVPISQGGMDEISNLAIACKACNSGKAGRNPSEAGMKWPVTVTVAALSPSKNTDTDTDTEVTASAVTKRVPRKNSDVKDALEAVLSPEMADAIIAHRRQMRAPLTAKAAEALAREFGKCANPNDGAETMLAQGWRGFKADWSTERHINNHRASKPNVVDVARAKGWFDADENQDDAYSNVEFLPSVSR
jgi:5-methylcytosine-specific restriction endonuclease McrA